MSDTYPLLCMLLIAIFTKDFGGSLSITTVSVKLIEYENQHGCDPYSECDFSFKICLGITYNGQPTCFSTRIFPNKNFITFTNDMQSVNNPVIVNFPDGIAAFLKIIVHETDTGPFYKYVTRWDEFVLPFVTTPRPNVLHTDLFGRTFRRTRLKIELSTYCTPPFYLLLEETCGKFCQKRNNQFGHYNCTSNGDKECLPGWTDTDKNCTTRQHDCETIKCKNGGTCQSYGVCSCYTGFTGPDCSIDVDECSISDLAPPTCDEENTVLCQNLVGTYTCHCQSGYTGKQCQTEVSEPPTTDGHLMPQSPSQIHLGLPIGLSIGLLLLIITVIVMIMVFIRRRKSVINREAETPGIATLADQRGSQSAASNEAQINPYIIDESTFINNNGALPANGAHPTPDTSSQGAVLPPYRVNEIPGPRDSLYMEDNVTYESYGNVGTVAEKATTYQNLPE